MAEMKKIKIILLGETDVGKTALLHRFKTGKFDETLPPTVSTDWYSKNIAVDGEETKIILWDTAGQEKFKSLTSSYFRNAEGVLLLYDVTNMNSFLAVSQWITRMRVINPDVPILIVGNKNEEDTRGKKVNLDVVHKFAHEGNFDNIEISVKTGENVQEAFLCLIRKIMYAKSAATAERVTAQGFSYLTEEENKEDKDDVITLTKDASIQTQASSGSWCSC